MFAALKNEERSVTSRTLKKCSASLIQINDRQCERGGIAANANGSPRLRPSELVTFPPLPQDGTADKPNAEAKKLMSQNAKFSVPLGQFSLVSFD